MGTADFPSIASCWPVNECVNAGQGQLYRRLAGLAFLWRLEEGKPAFRMMGDVQYWLGECALNKSRAI